MKKIINRLLIVSSFLLALASCKKDGARLVLESSGFANGGLKASVNSVVLSSSTDNDSVVDFAWSAAGYGNGSVAVTYTLQLDKVSDTATWANAKTFAAGSNITTYGFLGKDLNNLLNSMGLSPGSSSNIAVRIRSDVNQYNGSTSTVAPVFSNTLLLAVTPYGLNLYVPGAYQNWDPSSAPILNPIVGSAGLYEGFVNMAGTGIQYFKFTNAPDWNHTNYGDGGNFTFSTDGQAAGLSVPNGGYYELTADLNKNTWTATPTTWGIIGDATPGSWDNDTELTYDPTAQVWKGTIVMKQAGSFKFRANNAWNIDFGIDAAGNIQYADNPFFPYNPNLNNLTVPSDGTYTITLDLHVSGKYTYSLVKN